MLRALPLLLAVLLGLASRALRGEDLAWLESLDAARARALAEGRPVLAVFRCVP